MSLRVEKTETPDAWEVCGRGELHLSILVETMRREGFELQVAKPQVIVREIDGVKCEPVEFVQIDVPEEYVGNIIEALGHRKGELQQMGATNQGQMRLIFNVYSRGLIGFSTEFLTLTKGYGMINHSFLEYRPALRENIGGRKSGVLVSMENGKATAYGIMQLEDRGTIFIEPGTEVYEGMVVGESARDADLAVNITRAKQLTNMRTANKDNTVVLKRPKAFSLEQSLEYLNDDEYCEITPESIRIRKKILDKNTREKMNKKIRNGMDEQQ